MTRRIRVVTGDKLILGAPSPSHLPRTPDSSFSIPELVTSVHLRQNHRNVLRAAPRSVSAAKLAPQEKDPGKRMGAWEKLIHPVARRPYFVNKDTGQTCWKTPPEVGQKFVEYFDMLYQAFRYCSAVEKQKVKQNKRQRQGTPQSRQVAQYT